MSTAFDVHRIISVKVLQHDPQRQEKPDTRVIAIEYRRETSEPVDDNSCLQLEFAQPGVFEVWFHYLPLRGVRYPDHSTSIGHGHFQDGASSHDGRQSVTQCLRCHVDVVPSGNQGVYGSGCGFKTTGDRAVRRLLQVTGSGPISAAAALGVLIGCLSAAAHSSSDCLSFVPVPTTSRLFKNRAFPIETRRLSVEDV